jgi:hypothetical protein
MNKVFAIGGIAIRAAVRSRLVVVLLGLLLLAVVGLPLTIKGDGTLAGRAQILLSYTLGAVTAILSIATLWAGCAAVSGEIQERQITLVVTKPVAHLQIWLGKWLGLLALNAVLLALSGVIVYGLLRWTTRASQLSADERETLREEILVARRPARPDPVSVDEPARRLWEERLAAGGLPEGIRREDLYKLIKQSLLVQANAVPSGHKRAWTFRLPARRSTERPLLLRFKFSTSLLGDQSVTGLWRVGPPHDPGRFEQRHTNVPEGFHTIQIPSASLGNVATVVVEYANINPVPLTVFFPPEEGLELLVHEGGLEANLARSLLVVFFQLAFLGAVGVTFGSLLSLPVAVLASGFAVLLLKIGSYLQSLASQEFLFSSPSGPTAEPSVVDLCLRALFQLLSALVKPLEVPNPLELLAVGRLVGWSWVGSTFLIQFLLYSGILALLGAWLFHRREIGSSR